MAGPFSDRSGDHAMNTDRAVVPRLPRPSIRTLEPRFAIHHSSYPRFLSSRHDAPAIHPRDSLTAYPIDRHNRSIGRMWIRSSNVKERSPVENATPATKRCPKASRSLRSPASSLPATR